MVNARTDAAKHARKENACAKFWKKPGKKFSSCLADQNYSDVKIMPKFVEDACSADISATEVLPESIHVDS